MKPSASAWYMHPAASSGCSLGSCVWEGLYHYVTVLNIASAGTNKVLASKCAHEARFSALQRGNYSKITKAVYGIEMVGAIKAENIF